MGVSFWRSWSPLFPRTHNRTPAAVSLPERVNFERTARTVPWESTTLVPKFPRGMAHARRFFARFSPPNLPRRYQARLTREIQDRRQRRTFRGLRVQFAYDDAARGEFRGGRKIRPIYENMRAKYKYSIRLEDFANLADLTDRATKFEEIRKEEAREKQTVRKNVSAAKAPGEYDRANTCWRCKQRGHNRFNCCRPAKKFCSQCGKDGVCMQDCHPRPGNAAMSRRSWAPAYRQLRIKFTPRPHVTVCLLDNLVPALVSREFDPSPLPRNVAWERRGGS